MERNDFDDLITIVGTSYFQPIADLIENLLKKDAPAQSAAGTTGRENGYSVSLTVLLVAVLESFVSRLRFLRNAEVVPGRAVPDLLGDLFPDLPNKDDLVEIFLLRNIVVHNHVWHLDVSNVEQNGAPHLATPKALKFQTNQHYETIIDVVSKRTRRLGLNANPTAVDRSDVKTVFDTVWSTLLFMNSKNFSHTPLAGQTVGFRGKHVRFGELRNHFP